MTDVDRYCYFGIIPYEENDKDSRHPSREKTSIFLKFQGYLSLFFLLKVNIGNSEISRLKMRHGVLFFNILNRIKCVTEFWRYGAFENFIIKLQILN